jgi:PKD repeat protein
VNNPQGQPGIAFQFSCNPSGGSGSYSFSWDFGDGQTSTQQNPSHSFAMIGNFSVRVTVTSDGQTTSCSLTVKVFIQQSVFVGPGGGFANVLFSLAQAARIRITLSGTNNLIPYGFLEGPGYSGYFPPQGTANNGVNVGEINLSQAGQFTLTVFEGNNIGGNINVKIEVI